MERRWFGLMLAAFVAFVLTGCHGSFDIPRADIAAKVRSLQGRDVKAETFCQTVGGEPHKVVELGDKLYWYYYGTDGKIIVTIDAEALEERGVVHLTTGIRELD